MGEDRPERAAVYDTAAFKGAYDTLFTCASMAEDADLRLVVTGLSPAQAATAGVAALAGLVLWLTTTSDQRTAPILTEMVLQAARAGRGDFTDGQPR